MWHICENFWDVTTMNIDLQNYKSDQIFSSKYLVPAKMALVSPPEKVDLHEVWIIGFHTYLSFRAWLLYVTISKMFNLTKSERAKLWSDPTKSCLMGLR